MANVIKASQFVSNAHKFLGYKYIYGAKGNKYTTNQIQQFAKQYPSVYTKSYLTKSLKNANLDATDCSGLIYLATDKEYLLGSSQLYERAKSKGEVISVLDAPEGAILWRSGHVAIKVSPTQHIESRGVDYGVVVKNISTQKWTYALLMDFIDYSTKSITKESCKYHIKWMQTQLNKFISAKKLKGIDKLLVVDGDWGKLTVDAVRAFFEFKKWSWTDKMGYTIGEATVKALSVI